MLKTKLGPGYARLQAAVAGEDRWRLLQAIGQQPDA